ncbi:MAG: sigma-70 family RNA polymerase sigma factor [Blastocatellia bacterium]
MADNISQLLLKWSDGDKDAINELMPLVYNELRGMARSYLHRESKDITFQPTALVNEVYIRLLGQQQVSWDTRAQFFGMASKLMRNILVDHARTRLASKRGGGQLKVSLADADRISNQPDIDMIILDDALNRLAAIKPEHSRIVELRYFGGLTIEETATVLGVSPATVERSWAFARAWLRRQIGI